MHSYRDGRVAVSFNALIIIREHIEGEYCYFTGYCSNQLMPKSRHFTKAVILFLDELRHKDHLHRFRFRAVQREGTRNIEGLDSTKVHSKDQ
jgi:hypothetical protein